MAGWDIVMKAPERAWRAAWNGDPLERGSIEMRTHRNADMEQGLHRSSLCPGKSRSSSTHGQREGDGCVWLIGQDAS
mgnify:CR=1 FL=1